MIYTTYAAMRKAKLSFAVEAKPPRSQLSAPVAVATILDLYGVEPALQALACDEANRKLIVMLACEFAEPTLYIFEAACPEDARPRLAIAAARAWCEKPSDAAAAYAANAAAAAAYAANAAAAYAAAAYAAYAAAAAAYAANAAAAAYAAAAAARAVRAANAAAAAANAANAAARETEERKQRDIMYHYLGELA